MPGCLGVVHVPKTGGAAMRLALSRVDGSYTGPLYFDAPYYGRRLYVEGIPPPNRETTATVRALAEVAATHRIVIGHFAGPTLLAAGCASLALQVREPRSRILSLYRYWQTTPAAEADGWGLWGRCTVSRSHLPLREFLTSPGMWPAVDNVISRQVLGYRGRPWHPARALRRAYSALRPHLALVDWSTRSTLFLARICDHVGETSVPDLLRDNETATPPEEQDLDPATLRLVERLSRLDRRLVDLLVADGLLVQRSGAELDAELETTARRLRFRLA